MGCEGLIGPSGHTTSPLWIQREESHLSTVTVHISSYTREWEERGRKMEFCVPHDGQSWNGKHDGRVHHLDHVAVYVLVLESPNEDGQKTHTNSYVVPLSHNMLIGQAIDVMESGGGMHAALMQQFDNIVICIHHAGFAQNY